MPPLEVDPNLLNKWSPYAFILVWTILTGGVASALGWWASSGFDAYVRFSEYRAKRKLQKLQLDQAGRQPFTMDSIYEDRGLTTGFKALLKMQDMRIRELEDKEIRRTSEMQQLHSAHMQCVQDHAESEIARASMEKDFKSLQERYTKLETKFNQFTATGKRDPWPSPEPPPVGDKKNE